MRPDPFYLFNFFRNYSTKLMTLLGWLGRVYSQSTPFASFPLKQPAPPPFFNILKEYGFIPEHALFLTGLRME